MIDLLSKFNIRRALMKSSASGVHFLLILSTITLIVMSYPAVMGMTVEGWKFMGVTAVWTLIFTFIINKEIGKGN